MPSSRIVKCPTCGAPVAWIEASRFRPFCSERCRTMDLGDWASERRRIAGEPLEGPPDTGAEPDQDPPVRKA